MSIQEHAALVVRAKHALEHLEQHPETTRRQLGNARELVNRVHNFDGMAAVDAVEGLEQLVVETYGGRPDCACSN